VTLQVVIVTLQVVIVTLQVVLVYQVVFVFQVVIVMSMAGAAVNAVLEDLAVRCIFLNAVCNPVFYGLSRRNYRQGYNYITQACCHVISCGFVQSPPGKSYSMASLIC